MSSINDTDFAVQRREMCYLFVPPMRPRQNIFGKKLKVVREARYLTQRELADLVGISSERMGAIEQADVTGIDRSRIPRFAAALKLSEAQFLDQIGAPDDARGPIAPRTAADPRVTVDPDTYRKLQRMAEVDGVPIGAVIARFLDDQREQRAGAAPPPAPKPTPKPKKPTAPPSASKNVN